MISIIVPCYKCGKIIEDLIASLDKQTNKDFEVIFIEDCSGDDTYDKLLEITRDKDYSCVVLQNERNMGPGSTRNAGMAAATGEYITFVDSDDYLAEGAIEVLTKVVAENNSPDAVMFDFFYVKGDKISSKSTVTGRREGLLPIEDAMLYSSGSPWCKMYKRQIIVDNGIVFPPMKIKEDFVFNKLIQCCCKSIVYIKKPLYYYRYVKTSIMNTLKVSDVSYSKLAFDILNEKCDLANRGTLLTLSIRHYLLLHVQFLVNNRSTKKTIIDFIDEYTAMNPQWKDVYKKLSYGRSYMINACLVEHKNIFLLRMFTKAKRFFKGLL